MSYQLASSSTEEGEIVNSGFPYHKSCLQYLYYPHTSIFIGKNTLPVLCNYKSDLYCVKLKKDIKADYNYIFFNLLENKKSFFENKFVIYKDLADNFNSFNNALPEPFVLQNIISDYKEGVLTTKRTNKENSYSSFYKQIFCSSNEKITGISRTTSKLIVIEDRMVEAINKPNAFIFFRVIVQKTEEEAKHLMKIIFEEIFYNKMLFYEYLDLCASNIARNFNGYETRFYESKDTTLIIRSSTVFKYENKIRRIHNIDKDEKNVQIVFNKNEMTIVDFKGKLNDNIKYLNHLDNLDIPVGDYVLNNKVIYKISKEGFVVSFSDIDFTDFIKTRWN